MLSGQNVLCFAPEPWHSIWRNRQQIMSRLARANRVLYVEPKLYTLSGLRRGEINWSDVRRPRLTAVMENLWLYHHPVYGLTSGRRVVNRLGYWLRIASLRHAMRQLGMEQPILWLFHPKQAGMVGHCGEKLVCYHVVDEYVAFRWIGNKEAQALRADEEALLQRADLVFVVSQALKQSKGRFNPNTYCVPNGVDYARFIQAMANPTLPNDIATLPRPIIGYVGHISIRLNLALLRQIALDHPEWSLALVGSVWEHGCADELAALRSLPNVYFLGRKDVNQVPYYIKACQVCLIPYKQGKEAQNINPLKLYEYLACGKPVVSIDIPALEPFAGVVQIADRAVDFGAKIEVALREDHEGLVHRRQALVAAHTWDARVEELSRLITLALSSKPEQQDLSKKAKLNRPASVS